MTDRAEPTPKGLAERTVRNVAWLGSSQAIRQVISIAATVLMSRFLGPAEFGIFAMTIFVNELAQLIVDFGMGSALIQKKEVNERVLSSCFWINLGIGSVAVAGLIAAGPWVAEYFKQPIIQWLLVVSGLNLLVSSAAVIPQTLLSRRLAFRDVALGTMVGSVCGATTAVTLAMQGVGVWALAMQPLTGTLITTAYLFARARWRPRIMFDLAQVRGLLAFSGQLLVGNVVGHVTRNLPSLILGPAMGVAALGLISMAQTVVWLPVAQISQAIVRATFPVFAQLQDDMPRFRENFYRASGMISLFAFPMFAGLGVLAGDLMPLVFGHKWVEAAPLVTVLCVSSLVQSVVTLSGTALLASGRSATLMRLSFLGLPIMASLLYSFRETTPIQAVTALVAGSATLSLVALGASLRAMQGSWTSYLSPLARPLGCSVLMGAVLLGLHSVASDWPGLVRLIGLSLIGAATYVALSLLLNRKATVELLSLLRNALKR